MPHPASRVEEAFQRLRRELEIRSDFPADVLREAEVAARRRPTAGPDRADRRDIPFVTIDPPGSRDLDQAVHAEHRGEGFRLHYAIADVAFWVDRGSVIEEEAWRRGVTFYSPDGRAPLYPAALSAGAASLLPGQECPAILFTFDLDERGDLQSSTVERVLVRSRQQLTYAQLLRGATADPPPDDSPGEEWEATLPVLKEIGRLRMTLEVERGGVSLPIRSQQVQKATAEELGYEVIYDASCSAENWNEQISLLTGHVAAIRMIDAGLGILRTMPPMAEKPLLKLREIARTLGFEWPPGESYPDFIHGLDPDQPRIEVLVRQARRVLRGADYIFFRGSAPEQPLHAALALPYAHATAPLRRLADRYVLDLLATLAHGGTPSDAEIATLEALPPIMNTADGRSSKLERRSVDIAEAATLQSWTGKLLDAVVVDVRSEAIEFQVENPPVRATVRTTGDKAGSPALGDRVHIRVLGTDVGDGASRFEIADEQAIECAQKRARDPSTGRPSDLSGV